MAGARGRARPQPGHRHRSAAAPAGSLRATALEAAIDSALAQGVPHPNAVRLALERAREEQGRPPPVALCLSEDVARRDAPVRSHALASYDRIGQAEQPEPGEPRDE